MKIPRDPDAACRGVDEPISDLRFVAANALLQAKGVLGWVVGTHGGRSLDGLRVVRADDGRYVAQLSREGVECAGPGGDQFHQADHDSLEAQVLAELRGRGLLP